MVACKKYRLNIKFYNKKYVGAIIDLTKSEGCIVIEVLLTHHREMGMKRQMEMSQI